jgi:glycosyltransferase involved in cell wall biosynthesis
MDLGKLLHREPIADRGISVVIPAYNDAENLEAVVTGTSAVLDGMGRGYEVVVVNDGSTDSTAEVAERLISANKRVRVVHHAAREGYGAALRSGFRVAKYPLVLQLDGDNQYDAAQIDRLLGAINHVDVVCGYREPRPIETRGVAYWFYRWVLRVVFAVRVRDVNCGFRLFRRNALRRIPIQSNGRFANAEVLAKATFMNLLVGEVGVSCRARVAGLNARPDEGHRNLLREAAHVFRRPQFCTPNATSDRSDTAIPTA